MPGGRHKGGSERTLLAARSRLEAVIEKPEISDETREELEEVSALIRSVELSIGKERLERRPRHASVDFLQEGVIEGALEHREQLLQLYTEVDLAAAEGNRALSQRIPEAESLPSDTAKIRRHSTQELDARLTQVLESETACRLLDQAGTLSFDALTFAEVVETPLFVIFASLEQRLRLIKQVRDLGQVDNAAEFHGRLMHFMDKVGQLYHDANPYHSRAHAADVVMTLEWFFRSEYVKACTSPLDHLMSLIGAAIHDVGHPGQNNMFHQKTLSPLAIRYNDRSVLESMHVSLSFEVMQGDAACDWFGLLPADFRKPAAQGQAQDAGVGVNLKQYVRKALVQMILSTDMGKHAKTVQDLKVFVEEQAEPSQSPDEGHQNEETQLALEKKLLTLDVILHAADLSNPAKPGDIVLKWTRRVLAEFWAQGDEEKRLGLPLSPLCDREAEQWAVPKGQLGFINFVVLPLYTPLRSLIPEVQEALDNLKRTVAFWEERDKAKATYDQIFAAP